MAALDKLSPGVERAFKRAYVDLVAHGFDRTSADLDLLESVGLMTSRLIENDDDLFGTDSLEIGERLYEFTQWGQELVALADRKYALDPNSWEASADD